MFIDDLRKSILQKAIQGKLVEQNPNDEPASELLMRIWEEKEKLIKDGKIKKEKGLSPITAEEKLFDIPTSWEWIRVKDVCYFWNGEKMSWKKYPYLEARYLRGKDAGKIYSEWNFVEKWNRLILVDWENSWELFDLNEDWYLWSTFKIFNTYKSINADYLQKFLTFRKDEFRNNKTWAAIPHLNKDLFFNYPLPLPPLEEQKRIVAKLDELMPLLDEARPLEEEITKLEKDFPSRLRQSILQYAIQWKLVEQNSEDEPASELLKKIKEEKEKLIKEWKIKKEKPLEPITDEEKPFDIPSSWGWARLEWLAGNVIYPFADWPFGSNLKSEHYTDKPEVRIVQLSNIWERWRKDKNVKYTTFEHLKTIARSEVQPWDFVIAKMMPAGRAIIIPEVWTKLVLSSDAVKFVPNKLLNNNYLYYAINSSVFKEQVYSEVQWITRVRTSLWKLKNYLIPLPPLEEQKRIVAKLDELMKLCDELEEQIG